MIVNTIGDAFPCTSAVKGEDYIYLYERDSCTLKICGISDFSGYSIEGGEWTVPPKTDAQRIAELEAVIDALVGGETA